MRRASPSGVRRLPQFPPDDPNEVYEGKNTRLKRALWERLAKIARAEGKSRSHVIEFFLSWAADDYDATKRQPKK